MPNDSMLYGFGFVDLREEPVVRLQRPNWVLTTPDSNGLYYMLETVDMWTNAFAYPAGAKVGYRSGKYAYVGANWKGTLPAGLKSIDCPTPWILIQPRAHAQYGGFRNGKEGALGLRSNRWRSTWVNQLLLREN